MNSHKNIAEENSININNYEIRNTIVKDKWIIEYIGIIMFFLLALIFIIFGILNLKLQIASIISIVLGSLFFIFGIIILLHMIIFKLSFTKDYIIYKDLFKKEIINLKEIKKFKVENNNTRYHTIEIYYGHNKKIRYHISYTNKENFILLLNLLKLGVNQIY